MRRGRVKGNEVNGIEIVKVKGDWRWIIYWDEEV